MPRDTKLFGSEVATERSLNLVEISAAEKKKHCGSARRAATLSFFSQYHHSYMNVEASHTL